MSAKTTGNQVKCNGRSYPVPERPTVVVCIDGSEPGYIERAIEAGMAPNFARIMETGENLTALSAIPSFTNPNNMSIITGSPPAVHGIAGNYFFDPSSGTEVMMNEARFLRAPTVLKAFHDAGLRVAVVTAKDKLRALLCKGIEFRSGRAVGFSSEKADEATMEANGIDNVVEVVGLPVPDVYSSELSEFVMAAGVKLLKRFQPDVMYLSTTDYIQHKAAPGTKVANAFYAMMDEYIGLINGSGATLAITADHGMNDKHHPSGVPDVIYLQELFDAWLGRGRESGGARVILPITDPYVLHHGALGSFATVYLPDGENVNAFKDKLNTIDGVECALDKKEACKRFDLPGDRIGDIVVISTQHKVLGTSALRHDLAGLKEPLRSHGGTTEQVVPFLVNRKVPGIPIAPQLRNFDAFYYATRAAT